MLDIPTLVKTSVDNLVFETPTANQKSFGDHLLNASETLVTCALNNVVNWLTFVSGFSDGIMICSKLVAQVSALSSLEQ